MKPPRIAWALLTCTAVGACEGLPDFDFAIGDIAGLWVASSFEYRPNSGGAAAVDLIQRDGATFSLSVDNSTNPASVASILDDGMGSQSSGGGFVDPVEGTLTISGDVFAITQDGNDMTLTSSAQMFDFGGGSESATLIIELSRL